jgi:hypothetical protein
MTPSAATANAVQISNTKLAACLVALGFPPELDWLHDVPEKGEGKTVCEFRFRSGSIRPEFARLSPSAAADWQSGALETADPMHPLCVMMRAQHNYDRLLEMQRGETMNLRSTAMIRIGEQDLPRMTIYRPGSQLDPARNFSAEFVPEDDLALAAALGGVGLPVRSVDGSAGSRRYWLPRHGYIIHDDKGKPLVSDAVPLLQRAPTPADPRRLALEDTAPLHPVVLAYDALNARAALMKLLDQRSPKLHIRHGRFEILVTADHTGRVMDEIATRIGGPSLTIH